MKITMNHIARQTGVSRTTVSLVLKGEAGRYRITPATAARVTAAARRLGFQPNYIARALSQGATRVVGVVVPNMSDVFLGDILKGIEQVLHDAGYMMILCTSRYDRETERKNTDLLVAHGVDGILMTFNAPFKGASYDYSHLKQLVAKQPNTVFIDRRLPSLRAPSVVLDDILAARTATARLLQDRRSPGFISLDLDVSSIGDRLRGFYQACRAARIRPQERHLVFLGPDQQDEGSVRGILADRFTGAAPDCLLVSTGRLAFRVKNALESLGYRTGSDIALAKFGADPDHNRSGMLCVDQRHADMGREAALLLLKMIAGGRRLKSADRHVVLKPVIIDGK